MKKPSDALKLTKEEQDDLDVRVWEVIYQWMARGAPQPVAVDLAIATVELQLLNEEFSLRQKAVGNGRV
jgi:hypothetical protein